MNSNTNRHSKPHSIARTAEFLSCAKTALKIARSQNPPPTPSDWWILEPSQLTLHPTTKVESAVKNRDNFTKASTEKSIRIIYPELVMLLEDGLSYLRTMSVSLETLQSLVRRRGHTNDPTQEISLATHQLESDAKELATLVQQLQAFRSGGHHKKHLDLVATWLQEVAGYQMTRLKDILKVRATVLADQTQRMKLLNRHGSCTKNNAAAIITNKADNSIVAKNKHKQLASTPLFTATTTTKNQANERIHRNNRTDNKLKSPQKQRQPYGSNNYINNTSGTGDAVGGYGGYYNLSVPIEVTTGMRYRGSISTCNNNTTMTTEGKNSADAVQSRIALRQQERITVDRLKEAQDAERALTQLSSLFGKMSNLIVQQGETIDKLEDDVESVKVDIQAGQNEIQMLYSLKKGNRGLIIKTFAIIIFIVIFMRFY